MTSLSHTLEINVLHHVLLKVFAPEGNISAEDVQVGAARRKFKKLPLVSGNAAARVRGQPAAVLPRRVFLGTAASGISPLE